MNGDYDRLKQLLLDHERTRLDVLAAETRDTSLRLGHVPDLLADEIEQSLGGSRHSRLASALSEVTAGSLEIAVRRRPQAVVEAVYPVIGPAIRRALSDALRHMADDLDGALRDTFSLRALFWRLEAWRSGVPYSRVVLRHTSRYQVEHLFLIQPESGLLFGHITATGLPELDADAVAGMFTAINHFVRDSVSVEPGGGIGSATVGDYRLVVSDGPQARLVAFVRGTPSSDFNDRLHGINEELHAKYGSSLADDIPQGQAEAGLLEQGQLDELNTSHAPVAKGGFWKRHPFLILVFGLLLLATVAYAVLANRWSQQVMRIHDGLSQTPGLTLLSFDDEGRDRLRIKGLLDPLAPDPRRWMATHYPDVRTRWTLQPYLSLDAAMVARRVADKLALSPAMVRTDAQGRVQLQGKVSFSDWYRVRGALPTVPGVTSLDMSRLQYPQQSAIEALSGKLQETHVQFESGTATPTSDPEKMIATMARDLQALQRLGATEGIGFRVIAYGYTDEGGGYVRNRALRRARAEWLASRLEARLESSPMLEIDQGDLVPGQSFGHRIRATSVAITPLPVPP